MISSLLLKTNKMLSQKEHGCAPLNGMKAPPVPLKDISAVVSISSFENIMNTNICLVLCHGISLVDSKQHSHKKQRHWIALLVNDYMLITLVINIHLALVSNMNDNFIFSFTTANLLPQELFLNFWPNNHSLREMKCILDWNCTKFFPMLTQFSCLLIVHIWTLWVLSDYSILK